MIATEIEPSAGADYFERLAEHARLISDRTVTHTAPPAGKVEITLSAQLAAVEQELPYQLQQLARLAGKKLAHGFVVMRKRELLAALETFRAHCLANIPKAP